jgi:SWI/SNF-related matrix-associated actin-dependent regulator 1 of chromatin subfamily A
MQDWEGFILIGDEATAFKNPKAQIHQVCKHLSMAAHRMWAMTATLIKNNLMEGYGIYKVVNPSLFPMSQHAFMLYYCMTRMQRIPRSNRQIPVIIGYHPKKIEEFKDEIEEFFLGRPKFEVASELPALVSRIVTVGLSPAQQEKYDEALDGLDALGVSTLLVGENRADGEEEIKEVTKLTAITYFQEIVNHLGLIDCDGSSDKTDRLFELLSEGDLADEKVIIFTRFKRMVDILMPLFAKAKIKAVRVTGDENEDERAEAMRAFQSPDSDTRVICITMAGSDAINLQAAKAIVFYDTPWSAGDFIQIVGRMIRIGSVHDRCYAIHLVAQGRKKTVDHRIMEVMQTKMNLIEAVIGRRIKGEQDIGAYIPKHNDISEIFDLLREDAGLPNRSILK